MIFFGDVEESKHTPPSRTLFERTSWFEKGLTVKYLVVGQSDFYIGRSRPKSWELTVYMFVCVCWFVKEAGEDLALYGSLSLDL